MERPAFAKDDSLDDLGKNRPSGPLPTTAVILKYWRLSHLVTIHPAENELDEVSKKGSTVSADYISLYSRIDSNTGKLWILEFKGRHTHRADIRWSLTWFDEKAAEQKWRTDWASSHRLALAYTFRMSKTEKVVDLGENAVHRAFPIEGIKEFFRDFPMVWQNTEAVGGPTLGMLLHDEERIPG